MYKFKAAVIQAILDNIYDLSASTDSKPFIAIARTPDTAVELQDVMNDSPLVPFHLSPAAIGGIWLEGEYIRLKTAINGRRREFLFDIGSVASFYALKEDNSAAMYHELNVFTRVPQVKAESAPEPERQRPKLSLVK